MSTTHRLPSIILCGARGAGKTTVQHILQKKFLYKGVALAGTLKDAVSAIFSYPRDVLDGVTEADRKKRVQVDAHWSNVLNIPDFTMIKAMQLIGTELFRNKFCKDIWIESVKRKHADLATEPYVISDVRYKNEFDAFKKMGFVCVLITRPGLNNEDSHTSEQFHNVVEPDEILTNDGTLDQLTNKIQTILDRHMISTISKNVKVSTLRDIFNDAIKVIQGEHLETVQEVHTNLFRSMVHRIPNEERPCYFSHLGEQWMATISTSCFTTQKIEPPSKSRVSELKITLPFDGTIWFPPEYYKTEVDAKEYHIKLSALQPQLEEISKWVKNWFGDMDHEGCKTKTMVRLHIDQTELCIEFLIQSIPGFWCGVTIQFEVGLSEPIVVSPYAEEESNFNFL